MFSKLLKYEWKATAGVLGILSAAALGAGALGALALRMLERGTETAGGSTPLVIMGMLLLLAMLFFIVAYAVAVQLLLAARFYRNKFTDEGYLTFTLPVRSHKIVLSSLLNMVVWTVISAIVVLGAMAILFIIGTPVGDSLLQISWKALWESLAELLAPVDVGQILLLVVKLLVSLLCGNMTILCCITLGAVLAKRHKVLAAFGCYYGVNMLNSFLMNIISVAWLVGTQPWTQADPALTVSASTDMVQFGVGLQYGLQQTLGLNLIQLAWELLLLIGGYFLTVHLMERKLNLP